MNKNYVTLLLLLTACTTTQQTTTTVPPPPSTTVADGKLFTALYQQHAAEYKALCFQAYNVARMNLDRDSHLEMGVKKPAIVTDIDETVLDNSPFAVREGLMGNDYDQNAWYNWTSQASADTVPGAPAFLKYAASKGITVFYITNRDEKERNSTLRNLQKYGLPNADSTHLFLRSTTSSKETRRQLIISNYEILMLIGDNLADFSMLFDKKSETERNMNVTQLRNEFGSRFIVLPNPNYGDWENAVYQYNYNLSPAQKDSVIRRVLKSY